MKQASNQDLQPPHPQQDYLPSSVLGTLGKNVIGILILFLGAAGIIALTDKSKTSQSQLVPPKPVPTLTSSKLHPENSIIAPSPLEKQGSKGAGEQGSRGAGEQGSRGAEEQGSRGAGEQGVSQQVRSSSVETYMATTRQKAEGRRSQGKEPVCKVEGNDNCLSKLDITQQKNSGIVPLQIAEESPSPSKLRSLSPIASKLSLALSNSPIEASNEGIQTQGEDHQQTESEVETNPTHMNREFLSEAQPVEMTLSDVVILVLENNRPLKNAYLERIVQ
ncbi:MAG: hypothetical protein F6K41_35925 [Symploca sp. SIO3E6]|nr:hypothetical protein [Caldora sp. SIO3E6]